MSTNRIHREYDLPLLRRDVVERLLFANALCWEDAHIPRTDRPAIFYLYKMGAPFPHVVIPPAGFRRIATR